jgi:PIN domain nuclease of toxin-antitoxin system
VNAVFVSAASAWEISIKSALGRLGFPLDRFDDALARMGVEPLPIGIAHAIAAGRLPRHHDDPFDRMLVAQSQLETLVLVTEDAAIARYEVTLLGKGGVG